MNDDPGLDAFTHRLTEVRDSLGHEHMTIPVGEIFARDKRRRARHWLAATGAACAAIGVAAAVTLAQGGPARPAPAPARPAQSPGGTRLSAWTVQTSADGTVTFTLRNTSHPAQLQRALAKAGVRAVVRWGEICLAGGPGQPLIGDETGFMDTNSPTGDASYFAVQGGSGPDPDLGWSWTVIPSKMPRDGQFVISALPGPVSDQYIQAAWEFAKTSAPIACKKLLEPGQKA
jgi:hypothetical protein